VSEQERLRQLWDLLRAVVAKTGRVEISRDEYVGVSGRLEIVPFVDDDHESKLIVQVWPKETR
jgi:hypothetical protein